MDNIYAVTFITAQGERKTVEVEAFDRKHAQDIVERNEPLLTETTDVKLVSNRRDY